MRKIFRAALTFAALTFSIVPSAEPQTVDETLLDGWHVVRPGETLWDLAERYLGSEEAWPELHALNPTIANPDRISPGQRIRVQVRASHAADVAQVAAISRKVEEQLAPLPWLPSTELNMLNPRDGVRTYEASSSELLFPDSTRLTISEDSLVFIGRGGTVRRQVRRDEIEIVLGQADLASEVDSRVREVVVGESRMKPSPGRNEARLRRPDGGGAQVMVYAGGTVVESGGASQQVPAGMGTQMAEGKPPSPPEQLLPAPQPGTPEAGSAWLAGGPDFAWDAVSGAAGYVFEICLDPRCGKLVRRREIETLETPSADLEPATYHWRVTAVSASGLDGFPSAPRPFTVEAEADSEPPTIRVELTGPRIEREGTLYLGPGARLEVEVEDGRSGVERAWATLDGAEVELAAAQADWSPGKHEVVILGRDRAGNEGRSQVLEFTFDPLPPRIHWGPETGGVYHAFSGEGDDRWIEGQPGGAAPELVWSTDRATWRAAARQEWSLQRSVAPRFFLRSEGRRGRIYVLPGVSLPVKRGEGVGVLAVDSLVGTKTLEFRVSGDVDGAGDRRRRLVVEATDHLGNRSSVSWLLRRGRAERR